MVSLIFGTAGMPRLKVKLFRDNATPRDPFMSILPMHSLMHQHLRQPNDLN